MRIIRHLERAPAPHGASIVTLGNFDGVHVGHQESLSRVVRQARERNGRSVVVTFFPHPSAVLAPARAPAALGSLGQRLERIRESGVDTVLLQRFTREFAKLTALEFIERFLVDGLGAVKVIIGHSVSFGRNRRGSAATLEQAGTRFGFAVEVVGPVKVDGVDVSSTRVRQAVSEGEVDLAARLLGRPYAVEGRVVVGDRRGRGLGFPTANLRPRIPILAPDGVYAVRVKLPDGNLANGVANVGRKPTFGPGHERTLEAHLFEFDGDLYGRRLDVSLLGRLRGEMRFPSVEALVAQIEKDVASARRVLGA
ncbi:MAG: bifunctional riboflavin kinase/FAD synthetase [Candidatus Binatia bacterium]